MDTLGRHILVEYHGCHHGILNDLARVESMMVRAAEAAGASVVKSVFHPFEPQGVSGVVVIEESHLSIHTWPEKGYAAVDFYTCGDCEPERAHAYLKSVLRPCSSEKITVVRGLPRPTEKHSSMAIGEVVREGDDTFERQDSPHATETITDALAS